MTVSVQQHVATSSETASALRDSAHRSSAQLGEAADQPGRSLHFVAARSAQLGVNHLETSLDIDAEIDLPDLFTTALVHRGTVRCDGWPTETRLGAGSVAAMPRERSRVHLDRAALDVFYLPFSALRRVAWEQFNLRPGAFRLDRATPLGALDAARWGQVVAHIRAELTRPGSLLEHAFIEIDYLEDAAAVALHLFANNAASFHYRRGPSWSGAPLARRGADFIDEHAHRPITMSEVAEEIGSSPAELTRAFVDHYGTRPSSYLELVRLHRVHEVLHAADPGDGTTVPAVAGRFGFRADAAFVTAYTVTFGVDPERTLMS